jgi:ribosome modulation factor
MCEAKEKIKRLRALGSKPRKTEPRKKRHGAKTSITEQRRSHNTKRRVIDSKLGRSAMRAYPVMITGSEICPYKSAELQQLWYDPLYGRKEEKSVGNKKKGRGWYFTQDSAAHPSPVHNPPFQKDEAKCFM